MQEQTKKQKLYFWGTGSGCEKALANFTGEAEIMGFIDNNPHNMANLTTVKGYLVSRILKQNLIIL